MQQSMENVSAESAATTAMLKQLCDTLSTVQQQIADLSMQVTTTNAALQENRERTNALEARTEEIMQQSPPSSGTAPAVSPGTGIPTVPNSSDPRFGARFEEFRGGTTSDNTRPTYNPTPKMDFPKFDGENPKLWQTKCENYFEVYHVQPCLRTHFASLNFVQEAALWLQNNEAKLGRVENWSEMCALVLDQFGKNKYSLYHRQFRSLCQTGSVTKYYTKFQHIRHNLLLYNSALDDSFLWKNF
jgi:hypothetical protein